MQTREPAPVNARICFIFFIVFSSWLENHAVMISFLRQPMARLLPQIQYNQNNGLRQTEIGI